MGFCEWRVRKSEHFAGGDDTAAECETRLDNKLGYKIRKLRKSKGWTQEQLAEQIGIDNKHLSRIENGYHMPNYQIIKKLAQIFNFDIRNFEDLPINDIELPDKITLKSIQILNSAKNEKEKEYYLSVLQLAHKGLNFCKKN